MSNIKPRNFIEYFNNFPHVLENIFENIDDGTTVELLFSIKNKKLHTICNKSHHLKKIKSQLDTIFDNVKKNGLLLKNVAKEFQTEKICKVAVEQHGCALEYVENQTYKICKMAIYKDSYSYTYVKNKTFWLTCHLLLIAAQIDNNFPMIIKILGICCPIIWHLLILLPISLFISSMLMLIYWCNEIDANFKNIFEDMLKISCEIYGCFILFFYTLLYFV